MCCNMCTCLFYCRHWRGPICSSSMAKVMWRGWGLLYRGCVCVESHLIISIPLFLLPTFDSIPPVAERPQHMLMRVAVGIHKEDIDAAIEVQMHRFSFLIPPHACNYMYTFHALPSHTHIPVLSPIHTPLHSHTCMLPPLVSYTCACLLTPTRPTT